MFRRLHHWLTWTAYVGALVWAGSFYHAYVNLSIPAFGPPEQATVAVRDLAMRYGMYLVISVGAWLGLRYLAKSRVKGVDRIKVRGIS